MKELKVKIKRQTEALSLILNFPGKYKTYDLEDYFNVTELTIKRDLKDLRSLGVDVHSRKNKGLSVESDISDDIIKLLTAQYVGFVVNMRSFDYASNLLISKFGNKSIAIIAMLQMCVDRNYKVKFIYYQFDKEAGEEKIVEPLCVFQSDKNWRLLAKDGKALKQYLLCKMESPVPLEIKFNPVPQEEIDEAFETSFRSWIGGGRFKVKLLISEFWADRVKKVQLMENQIIKENGDGSITLELLVNSLSEISGWIVARGEGIIVLEPEELKNLVITAARGALKNYE